jgi:glycosyltransferase involved in cell wall biosynthesis
MKIAYYMPFKPMGHPNPSGDLVTGTELYDFFRTRGHGIKQVSRLRCRWLYLKPWTWGRLLLERARTVKRCQRFGPDIWLSYHSYYKAPDMLGPWCSSRLQVPYVLFQGVYSTKRRRSLKTLPGFVLNRRALLAAQLVFTNKKGDELNLLRLLPADRVVYVPPGIHPQAFSFDPGARQTLRDSWQVDTPPVVLTAAMFRPDVKTEGILEVIDACARIIAAGTSLRLVIVGDGATRQQLEQEAHQKLPGTVLFTGRVPRSEMYRYYSAADLFAFPGIRESLGMVYLEAQSCGLPVVAYRDWGAAEAVIHEQTGLLAGNAEPHTFIQNIERLVLDRDLRKVMGRQAAEHVRRNHDLLKNYGVVERKLAELAYS